MARAGRLNNASRIINLIYFLGSPRAQAGDGVTSREVRGQVPGYDPDQSDEAFERQFRRDRKELASLGFPMERTIGPNRVARYRLAREGARQETPDLDLKDISLLEICAANALESASFVMRDELVAALAKIKSTVGPLAPETGGGRDAAPDAAAHGEAADERQLFDAIRAAIDHGAALGFSYCNASGSEARRRAFPLRVFAYLGDLYLLAYDLDREATRRFRLDRISGEAAEVPVTPEQAAAALAHREDGSAVLPFQYGEARIGGKVFFSGKVAFRAKTLSMGQGELSDHGAGKLWTVDVADPAALARWSVENGPGILIVEPPEAAALVREGLARAASAHAAPADDGGHGPESGVDHGAA